MKITRLREFGSRARVVREDYYSLFLVMQPQCLSLHVRIVVAIKKDNDNMKVWSIS